MIILSLSCWFCRSGFRFVVEESLSELHSAKCPYGCGLLGSNGESTQKLRERWLAGLPPDWPRVGANGPLPFTERRDKIDRDQGNQA